VRKETVRNRLRITARGAVQGVGFRPFVYRLATELHLHGWVVNSTQGVTIEVEGDCALLDSFLIRLSSEKPPRSFFQSLESRFLDVAGYTAFEIRESISSGEPTALILPDIATCEECLAEIFDPANRRYRYPFTNCTNCGPRYSIITQLPYDRPNTSMRAFTMCPECMKEYNDPADRRFHAQPNACPVCGPHVELWDAQGKTLAVGDEAMETTAAAILAGKIVAVKGIGGFLLMTDARNEDAVKLLRQRKLREEKPFALMYPSIEMVQRECVVGKIEERLLRSPEAPLVLLQREKSPVAFSVAQRNPNLAVMLPYSPLHHILIKSIGVPVIATSANRSDEPMCTDEHEALTRLSDIADMFLIHDRPILRVIDDSIVRVMAGREMMMRRARGFAPLPVTLKENGTEHLLAVGAHLKNTIALSKGNDVIVSQHLGDLETQEAFDAFRTTQRDLLALYRLEPRYRICDLHPDYLSTKEAKAQGTDVIEIQHHYAHIAACMAENEVDPPVLGVAWDGTGFGTDGTIWGGEFLVVTKDSFVRVASLRPFRLPGGDRAVREPRRSAVGLLFEIFGSALFDDSEHKILETFDNGERSVLCQMLEKGINAPVTTSAGRLFDAVAAILGIQTVSRYEGQAAMELEFLTSGIAMEESYPFALETLDDRIVVDWAPMILELLKDVRNDCEKAMAATRFHNTLVEMIVHTAKKIGQHRVVLSGGCFQNKYLTERTIKRLMQEKFAVSWHQRVPPNDGGISLGQIAAARRILRKRNVIA
jgi:hydrogenase maturation protein HypF